MRIGKRYKGVTEGDLTPMIDMTFQLIAFFMVLINFSQTEQQEQIQLPTSELAKPPESPFKYPITINLTNETRDDQGIVVLYGQRIPINALRPYLDRELTSLRNQNLGVEDATIIIRAHKDTPVIRAQNLIKKCQESQFEKFVLRAKEQVE